jgi:hypothetical protein
LRFEVRRHDLHAVFVKGVLDLRVQVGKNRRAALPFF